MKTRKADQATVALFEEEGKQQPPARRRRLADDMKRAFRGREIRVADLNDLLAGKSGRRMLLGDIPPQPGWARRANSSIYSTS